MKELIEFLGNGQCFICGGTIKIIEIEQTEIDLEPNGMPNNFETVNYIVYGMCPTCGKLFNVEKVNMSYRQVNRLKKLIPTLELVENLGLNPFGYKKNERV